MSFDHAGNASLGKPVKIKKKTSAPILETPEAAAPSEAPPLVVESFTLVTAPAPYEEPVTITEPPKEEVIPDEETDEEEILEEGDEEITEEAAPEAADLVVADDGASIVTASQTRAQRKKKKRGRPAKKSIPFIPEGLND